MSSAYLRWLIFLLAILIPACASSAFVMMYSAYKLNKQGDNIQPWHTPFPIWNQSIVPCPVLSVASWPIYRFLQRQFRWSGIPISFRIFQFVVIHTVKGFGVVNDTEVDAFLKLSCFFYDPTDVGNLISGFSAFSNFQLEHLEVHVSHIAEAWLAVFWAILYYRVRWVQCVVVGAFFGIAFFWDCNENWPFPVLWPLLSFPNFLACIYICMYIYG